MTERPDRPARVFPTGELPLSAPMRGYLTASHPESLYQHHQIEAISVARRGTDPALTTGTASGEGVSFYVGPIEDAVRDPGMVHVSWPSAHSAPARGSRSAALGGVPQHCGSAQGPSVTLCALAGMCERCDDRRRCVGRPCGV